jgi:hypothetical protein
MLRTIPPLCPYHAYCVHVHSRIAISSRTPSLQPPWAPNSRGSLQVPLTNVLRRQARAVLSASVSGEWTITLVGVTRMRERCGPSRSDQKPMTMLKSPWYPPMHLKDESRLSQFVSHASQQDSFIGVQVMQSTAIVTVAFHANCQCEVPEGELCCWADKSPEEGLGQVCGFV